MKNIVLTSLTIVSIIGCVAPNNGHQNSTQIPIYQSSSNTLKTMSFREVERYSVDLANYIKINGDEKAIEKAQNIVRQKFKDPDSAKFQNVKIKNYNDGKVLCGEVNAKNSYGGYVGYKPFVSGNISATVYSNSSKYQDINDNSNAGILAACGE